MIKHVVCYKFKEPTEENLRKAKEVLLSMVGRVPEVKAMNVGIDILHTERSYDLILEVVLESVAAMDLYQKDEYHCSVVKAYMQEVREASIAIDFEL